MARNVTHQNVDDGKNKSIYAVCCKIRYAIEPEATHGVRIEYDSGYYQTTTELLHTAAVNEFDAKQAARRAATFLWGFVAEFEIIIIRRVPYSADSLWGSDGMYYGINDAHVHQRYVNFETEHGCRMLRVATARRLEKGTKIANFNDHLADGSLRIYKVTSVYAPKRNFKAVRVRAQNGLYNAIELLDEDVCNWFEVNRDQNAVFIDGQGIT